MPSGEDEPQPSRTAGLDANTLMASRRTDLAYEQSGMAADRTQMSDLRTALSLIGFGFTIYKFFQEMASRSPASEAFALPARRFGFALVVLGVGLLVASIVSHQLYLKKVRARARELFKMGLLPEPPGRSISPNVVVSVLLLAGGLLVILGIGLRTGPFG